MLIERVSTRSCRAEVSNMWIVDEHGIGQPRESRSTDEDRPILCCRADALLFADDGYDRSETLFERHYFYTCGHGEVLDLPVPDG